MPTTTNYGWTTPADTDLVKDGAAAIRTLGSSIDTTTKNLNPSTTLGDIEYRSSTANTNTRLPIGTTGQVLKVSGGVPSWGDAGSAGPNFALLNSGGTALTGATTITVSFTAKDYLFIRIVGGDTSTNNSILTMRLNADTGTNYPQVRWRFLGTSVGTFTPGTTFDNSATSFLVAQLGETPDSFSSFHTISGAKASGIKTYQARSHTTNVSFATNNAVDGLYSGSSDITSVSIISSTGNFTAGTIYVYGA